MSSRNGSHLQPASQPASLPSPSFGVKGGRGDKKESVVLLHAGIRCQSRHQGYVDNIKSAVGGLFIDVCCM